MSETSLREELESLRAEVLELREQLNKASGRKFCREKIQNMSAVRSRTFFPVAFSWLGSSGFQSLQSPHGVETNGRC